MPRCDWLQVRVQVSLWAGSTGHLSVSLLGLTQCFSLGDFPQYVSVGVFPQVCQ